MPKNVVSYSVLISCPSDVLEFLPLIEEAISSFNITFGKQNGIALESVHWTQNSYANLQKGMSAQEQLNRQIVEECDMLIGVFWTRFGTPTEKYGSGTEEEISLMLDNGKPVILYFLDKLIAPSKIDPDQLRKVNEFKKKHEKDDGLYFVLNSESELALKLRDHLELRFMDLLKANKRGMKVQTSSDTKSILWVDDQPENNSYARKIFEESGIEVITALSTNQAMAWLENNEVSVIISDMGRKEGKYEGYVLLDKLRSSGNKTPYIIFAGSRSPQHVAETRKHGGQGCTNDSGELINMVTSILLGKYNYNVGWE